jgi:hypothetical protein
MTCTDCNQPFNPEDSLMGDEGQCQNCWEAESSRGWWLELLSLENVEASNEHHKFLPHD